MADAAIIVAGHVCLDIVPQFHKQPEDLDALLVPGKLVSVGAAVLTTGGAVSNTGLALHRLGLPVKLIGKVGDDLFGRAVRDLLREKGDALTAGMVVTDASPTSYSIVIDPPGIDRFFFHCSGANDTFVAADVTAEALQGARLFHFGYPPIMRAMYQNDGAELAALLQRVQAAGLTVSLDMAYPDPESEAGRLDWRAVLARALPHVDLFLPSLEEIVLMLRPDLKAATADGRLLHGLAGEMLALGTAVAVIKLGDQGLYLRTTADHQRLAALGADPAQWTGRELLAPCFQVQVVGTTGAGDCTIAGFLAAFVRGLAPEQVMLAATAAGAYNVESPHATADVPTWEALQARVAAGWPQRPVSLPLAGWRRQAETGLYVAPGDRSIGPGAGED